MTLKKVLAFAVALAMVMSMIPAGLVAFAEEGSVVAAIGDVEYTSLTEAMAAVDEMYDTDAIEVTLLKNSSEDFVLEYGVAVLNTNGNSYSGTATVGGVLIADCEIENVVCALKGASYDKTKFGYAGFDAGVETVEGAQVRIGGGKSEGGKVVGEDSGLRFVATANLSDTLAAIAYGFFDAEEGKYAEGYEIGVKLSAEGSDSSTYVPATLWQEEGKVFTAALTNLKESNYNRRYTAKAYVTVEGVVFEDVKTSTRSIYQVASGLLSRGEGAEKMSEALVGMLNAYVNQTGVRLTLTDAGNLDARLEDKTGGYTGDAFFTVGDTTYKNGKYAVTLEAIGKSIIDTRIFNEYVRINNNNSKVSPVTGVKDNGDGTYTVTFDYADIDGKTSVINEAVSLTNGKVTAVVPEGVQFTGSADKLSLVLKTISEDKSAVEAGEGEELNSFDIHVMGIAEGNVTPVIVTFSEMAEKGLNRGNLRLYHVEDGVNVEMEQVETVSDLKKHNQFAYDPVDGTVVMALASFSEVAAVSTDAVWEGTYATGFAGGEGTEADPYIIANADQLAHFAQVVGGMGGQTRDSFAGKYIKLVNNIDLGDAETDNTNKIFYPIGYYNSTESYTKISGGTVTSSPQPFSGTFDGNGHTISNFYQNTWEMFGDYNTGYSGTPNHYKDAMGLFGYVLNGKVCNLTVDNFSSDGEFTPTGVIAAFAVNSTFENIAVTNCNPRVYNTGNGGIVGIGGNSDDTNEKKLTFTNITIDNTNKISALWGSWDVACGGLMGMFRGYSKVEFTNCHVAAQIDAYNDVCGNYQYYWYRYSGMMIGSLRGRNTTDTQGYTVPDMKDITAEGCTVHFGTWNDYYYCELVANSIASYTHDHQFSRLEQIASLDEIWDGNAWLKTGNFLLISGDTKTCYHIVKNTDGTLKQHTHTDAGEQTVNGETVPVEDKTIVYLPFKQLFQGDGWGVKHVPIYDDGTLNPFKGVTILDRVEADSVEKFTKAGTAKDSYTTGAVVTVGELFEAIATEVELKAENIMVSVSAVGENSDVTGTYKPAEADENGVVDWTKGTLTLNGVGEAVIAIQDYYFCTPTTINVTVVPVDKFTTVFENTDKYLYRVGNNGYNNVTTYDVKLGDLFKAIEGADIGDVTVEVKPVIENGSVSGEFKTATTWTDGTLNFSGTGPVEVTITDNKYAVPYTLNLEVVDAKNVTTVASATANNVVLLNDTSGTFSVSNGYTFYGNGFKVTLPTSHTSKYSAGFVGYINMNGGNLDNVQIVGHVYPESYIYRTQAGNETDGCTYFYNSVLINSGDCKITNSYISGSRAAIYVKGGRNLIIENSTISGGAYANIEVDVSSSVTLNNVITEQKSVKDSYGQNKDVIGLGIVVNSADTVVKIEEEFNQYNWITQAQWDAMLGSYSSQFPKLFTDSTYKKYWHYKEDNTTTNYINMGIIYGCNWNKDAQLVDGHTNTEKQYDSENVTIAGCNGGVYTITNAGTLTSELLNAGEYIPTKQSAIAPKVVFNHSENDVAVSEDSDISCVATTNTYGEEFVKITYTKGSSFEWATNIIDVTKGTNALDYEVFLDGVKYDAGTITFEATDEETHVVRYVFADPYNYTLSDDGIEKYSKEYFEDVTITVAPVAEQVKHATFTFGLDNYNSKSTLIDNAYYVSIDDSAINTATLTQSASTVTTTTGATALYYNSGKTLAKATINGADYYFPMVNMFTSDGKWTHGKTDSWYGCFPVFDGVVTITDYANGGTGSEEKYTSTTQSLPSGLSALDPQTVFRWQGTKTIVPTTPTVVSNKLCYTTQTNLTDNARSEEYVIAQYKYVDNAERTYYYYVAYYCGKAESCVTPETLITLADGSQVEVQDLKGDEELLVWNLETGKYDTAPIVFVDVDDASEYEIIHLFFEDETDVEVIYEHGFFDVTCGEYVYLDRDSAEEHIGHSFVMQDDIALNTWKTVELTEVKIEKRVTKAYSPVTYEHLCYYTDGMLSMPGGIAGLFNIFEVDTEIMAYDAEKMAQDIETYGLFTYEDFADIIPEEAYNAYNGDILKVSIGKGLLTWEKIEELAARYVK